MFITRIFGHIQHCGWVFFLCILVGCVWGSESLLSCSSKAALSVVYSLSLSTVFLLNIFFVLRTQLLFLLVHHHGSKMLRSESNSSITQSPIGWQLSHFLSLLHPSGMCASPCDCVCVCVCAPECSCWSNGILISINPMLLPKTSLACTYLLHCVSRLLSWPVSCLACAIALCVLSSLDAVCSIILLSSWLQIGLDFLYTNTLTKQMQLKLISVN